GQRLPLSTSNVASYWWLTAQDTCSSLSDVAWRQHEPVAAGRSVWVDWASSRAAAAIPPSAKQPTTAPAAASSAPLEMIPGATCLNARYPRMHRHHRRAPTSIPPVQMVPPCSLAAIAVAAPAAKTPQAIQNLRITDMRMCAS